MTRGISARLPRAPSIFVARSGTTADRPLIEFNRPLEAARHLAWVAYLAGIDDDRASRHGAGSHHHEEDWPRDVQAAFDRIKELLPE